MYFHTDDTLTVIGSCTLKQSRGCKRIIRLMEIDNRPGYFCDSWQVGAIKITFDTILDFAQSNK